ncbi:SCO1431 family membrane protein [Streptomyces sp. NPDC058662]|uniref:SCO1431 family membrane protein n=1 Tax=Streptomyces sp. NPDC058662 TaxID=3346583 RepID=UPI00364F3519
MTATTAAASVPASRLRRLVRTGGPEEESSWAEHVLGWVLVVVVAMFVTQIGWL